MLPKLLDAAKQAQRVAYAPYSNYQVGAAVLGTDGKIYAGCNIENASYGLTMCAERAAISAMISAGCRELTEVAIVTEDGGTPCGMCRQTLAEFTSVPENVWIHLFDRQGYVGQHRLSELLPAPFSVKPDLARPLNE
ncbi:cytidine deaminase [Kamptonema cortianum]|nr:cytidine deaminase [Geitlerinema splendidum]MDK3157656.1 cytidine deaminase [Kamptonema cortianum]